MDQLSAHLDRGWDLINKGDLRGARSSARRALEIDKDSPEAHNLLGYTAAQEGDPEEALEHYRQAMALDDGYIDPMLNAAEVLIHPLHEYDEAVSLCDEVLDFAEGREEICEALLLKFDALLAKGEEDGARATLEALPDGPVEGPVFPFLIGRAWYELGEVERAEPFLTDAVREDPRNADAHYYLGLVHDAREHWRQATLSFMEARDLDLAAPAVRWSLPREQFHRHVERALQGLEARFLAHLEGALVLVTDAPGMEMVVDGVDPRAPLLVEGFDQAHRDREDGPRMFVYQRNIEKLCRGPEYLEEELAWQFTEELQHLLEAAPASLPAVIPAPSPAPPKDDPGTRKKPRKKDL
ncbi:MAG: tetratricopeptide repeat protein [Deltaproteobacteria bacterium]|nr:tetratricopeptide repeat protein [Deltaproteobacteria bacterium]